MFTLQKDKARDFVLLNLSDPQLGTGEWAEDHVNRKILEKTVSTLIDRVHPDLITVSGDISWAGNHEAYRMFSDYMDSFQIPWAPIFGNHDDQLGAEEVDIPATEFMKHPFCIFEKGDPAIGCGNYIIKIEEDGKPVSAVIMIDSHDRMPYQNENGEKTDVWAKLPPRHLAWYKEQVLSLKEAGCSDTVMILHIPIYGYHDAYDAAFRADIDPKSVLPEESSDSKFWNSGYEGSFGVKYEEISSYPEDEGALKVIEELNSTKYIVAGHDHVNNFVIPYHGIRFIFSLKCGAGCYWNPILNGGTVLTIGSDGANGVRHEYVDVSEYLG